MRRNTIRVFVMLMVICTICQPLSVCAAETVDVTRDCRLELEYSSSGMGFAGLEIRIFRVAEMFADGEYALTAPFDALPVKIHGITSQKEWKDAADTLAAYIASEQIAPTKTGMTDSAGKVVFTGLDTGIYLVTAVSVETETTVYYFENFCVFLPRPQSDGSLAYEVTAKPKYSSKPKPQEPDEPKLVQYQVVKLWKDTGISSLRPKSVAVAILKDGTLQETVTLSEKNNWTYGWSAPEGDGVWTVVEKDVPDAYTVVITHSGNVFTITNSRPAPEGAPPKTGDTFAMLPWLTAMSLSGMLLMALGIFRKRKSK